MVMKNEWKAWRVATFDDGLIVCEGIKRSQSYFLSWKSFKETKAVSCCITQHQQQKHLAISEYKFQDLSNLYNVWTNHLSYHKERRTVCRSKDNHLVVKLVTIFQYGTEVRKIVRCHRRDFSWKNVLWCCKEATEQPERFIFVQYKKVYQNLCFHSKHKIVRD